MTIREPRFQVNQKVWKEGRKQPNGYIILIRWVEEEVKVYFYDGTTETLTFAELDGNWSDKFDGIWLVYKT